MVDYETHYGEPPALPSGTDIRLYSMEYCPFAEVRATCKLNGWEITNRTVGVKGRAGGEGSFVVLSVKCILCEDAYLFAIHAFP